MSRITARAAMADSAKTIEISVLGRSYKIACAEGERAALLEAAAYLDGKMGDIKKAGKVSGTDRIAMLSAAITAMRSVPLTFPALLISPILPSR